MSTVRASSGYQIQAAASASTCSGLTLFRGPRGSVPPPREARRPQRFRGVVRRSFIEPERNPFSSTTTSSKPAARTAATTSACRSSASGSSPRSTSTEARSPMSRTRRLVRPWAASRSRTAASARSTRASRCGVTSTPYATLEERHAAAGLSHVGSPHRCEASRTCALVSPASRRGATAPRSSAARMPGRKPATASSAFVPVATVPMPRASASGVSTSISSALQKKQRSPPLAR